MGYDYKTTYLVWNYLYKVRRDFGFCLNKFKTATLMCKINVIGTADKFIWILWKFNYFDVKKVVLNTFSTSKYDY